MGYIHLGRREVFQDEKAISLSLSESVGWEEDNCLAFMALEIKMELEKINNSGHMVFNVKCPFSGKLSFPEHIRFLSLVKKLALYSNHLAEERVPTSLSLFCRIASFIHIPVYLRSLEFFIESSKHRRRTVSTNDLGNFFVEYAPAAGPGYVTISPSVQWIFDSVGGTRMGRNLLKSPLHFLSGTLDSTIRPVRARSFDTEPTKSSEVWKSSPSSVPDAFSTETKAEVTLSSSKPELKISERLASCSSTNSTSSYHSTSSQHNSISKGMLHCMWKNGYPYFIFRMGEDCDKLYVAILRKVESSVDKALDYIYSFHSWTGKKASDFVGKMKVSSSVVLSSNRSKLIETEFVLFGANKDHSKEIKSPSSTVMKSKGLLSKKMTDIFRPSHLSKHKPTCRIDEPSSQTEDCLWYPCLSEFSDFVESVPNNHLENDFPPDLELAAIIIKDARRDSNKKAEVGGWGLKFLEKVSVDRSNTSLGLSFPSERCEGGHRENGGSFARSMDVLVPAGFHGGPITKIGGPSSLAERWRSGGHCDCGGWDIGCALTVLHDRKFTVSNAFPQEGSQEDRTSVCLCTEGAKHGEPALKMVNMNEDAYIMYFHQTLSALQSFSIGVAIIHTQTPSLYPEL